MARHCGVRELVFREAVGDAAPHLQGLAACVWAVYGVLIQSLPIVVANLIVAGVALASSFRRRTALPEPAAAGEPGIRPAT